MKKILLLLIGLTVISCNEKPEINLDTFLLAEKFCTPPDADLNWVWGNGFCFEFLSDTMYITMKDEDGREKSRKETHPFKIIKTIKKENLILLNFLDEKGIYEFTVIHQDTISFNIRRDDDKTPDIKLYKVNQ